MNENKTPEVMQVEVVEKKRKLSPASIVYAVLAAMMIIAGVLATIATFLGWEAFKMYYVAGTGWLELVIGGFGLTAALTGCFEEDSD